MRRMLGRAMFLGMKVFFLNWSKKEVLLRVMWKLIVMEMVITLQVVKMGHKKVTREKGECTELYFYFL